MRGLPRVLPLLLVLTALPAAGCAALGMGPRAGPWEIDERDRERITVYVDNQHFSDARIFARWNGERRRLGTVVGNTTDTFTMPGRYGDLRLEVDFVAGGSYVSGTVSVAPGENVHFRIPPGR